MSFLKSSFWLTALIVTAGCTTVANPGPNAERPKCQTGEQLVCSGATASRTSKTRDPHSICRCEPRVDQM